MRKVNVALMCAILLIGIGTVIYLTHKQPKATEQPVVHRSGPAPLAFDYPIEVKADSYPLHAQEEFIIQPKDKAWEGSLLNIYYVEANLNELFYKHLLPSDNKLLGNVEINGGQWSFKWQAPEEVNKDGYANFYIAVKSDLGVVSGTPVETLPYGKFTISPVSAAVGQKIQYSIEGFQKGCTMEVYLIQVKPNIVPGETIGTLGTFKKTNGSISSTFTLSEEIEGHKITPGQYIIQATIIPKNEEKEPRQAVFAYFNVK